MHLCAETAHKEIYVEGLAKESKQKSYLNILINYMIIKFMTTIYSGNSLGGLAFACQLPVPPIDVSCDIRCC